MPTLSRKPKTLKVVCNPFAALHHLEDGEVRCAGAFPREPDRRFGDDRVHHIGARLVAVEITPADAQARVEAVHDRGFEFTHEVQEVPRTEYYRRALMSRELLAADEETHAYAFGSKLGFQHPHRRIAQKSMEHEGLLPAHFGELVPEKREDEQVESEKDPLWAEVLEEHKAALAAEAEKAHAEHAKALEADRKAAAPKSDDPTHHDA